ncbi:MAG: molybdopterin-dependent oxidoreductase, partial [Candidatus Melainabacteria bacterium]|nr:molybdopterin-dependent oxidoreductase [Candidatus Melainabacteria bacterium]
MPVVGNDVPNDSAIGHVTGKSTYIDDLRRANDELLVGIYSSPTAYGRIKVLDLSQARKVPGVVELYTYKSLTGTNRFGPITEDEHLLAEDLVEYVGQPIVVIASESIAAIQQARAAIKIEIEELQPILSIDAAKAAKQFIGETRVIRRGNIAKGFAEAVHTREGTFVSEGQDHFYLESQAALAVPGEPDSLTIYSSTQNPSEVQEVIAQVLG